MAAHTGFRHTSMEPKMTNTDHRAVLRRRDVEERVGLARSTIYDLMSKGLFPRPIRLSARAVAWRSSDIQRWLDEREQA